MYWVVTLVETGYVYKSVVREYAEVVFSANMRAGREVQLDRENDDGTVDFIKRYSGAYTRRDGHEG